MPRSANVCPRNRVRYKLNKADVRSIALKSSIVLATGLKAKAIPKTSQANILPSERNVSD